MLPRALAFALFSMGAASSLFAQEAYGAGSFLFAREAYVAMPFDLHGKADAPMPTHAWLDLRQTEVTATTVQHAPEWVESVTLEPPSPNSDEEPKSVFRIRISKPRPDLHAVFVRLFFDDVIYAQPQVVAWDETGGQVLRSALLGSGINLAISESVVVPALGASAIDIEVPGDGTTVRGVYLDWMTSSEVARPVSVEHQDLIRAPFSLTPQLRTTSEDTETFGSVTATLSSEIIPIGGELAEGAGFQFQLEAQPLLALLTFELATPMVEAPPKILVNGEEIGTARIVFPDLADPAYRGVSRALVPQVQFQYTGWVRAQILVPPALLQPGTNDVIVVSGGGARSAVRATQLQLKYLWEKSDYVLKPK